MFKCNAYVEDVLLFFFIFFLIFHSIDANYALQRLASCERNRFSDVTPGRPISTSKCTSAHDQYVGFSVFFLPSLSPRPPFWESKHPVVNSTHLLHAPPWPYYGSHLCGGGL